MDIKPYSQQLAQSASHSRTLATLGGDDSPQGGGWDQQVSLSGRVLTYEHLAGVARARP